MSTNTKPGEHDWPEDFEHENGRYFNRCVQCYVIFTGYKRRVGCRKCAKAAQAKVPNA